MPLLQNFPFQDAAGKTRLELRFDAQSARFNRRKINPIECVEFSAEFTRAFNRLPVLAVAIKQFPGLRRPTTASPGIVEPINLDTGDLSRFDELVLNPLDGPASIPPGEPR